MTRRLAGPDRAGLCTPTGWGPSVVPPRSRCCCGGGTRSYRGDAVETEGTATGHPWGQLWCAEHWKGQADLWPKRCVTCWSLWYHRHLLRLHEGLQLGLHLLHLLLLKLLLMLLLLLLLLLRCRLRQLRCHLLLQSMR